MKIHDLLNLFQRKDKKMTMEEPRRFAIGMYEDAMRGEHKFK